ncbi:MAG: hypothetical protein IT285_09550 [Bdellovibrionales bacterium]|nr:hypothetical protein [Bdellovibrionales bacterium]
MPPSRTPRCSRLPRLLLGFLLGLNFAAPTHALGEEILLVAGPGRPASPLSPDALRDAFLGYPAHFEDGSTVKAIDRKNFDVELRRKFFEKAVGKSPIQMKAHWSQLVFTGRGYPPRSASSMEELRALMGTTPGTVSFVSAAEPLGGLVVIQRLKLD